MLMALLLVSAPPQLRVDPWLLADSPPVQCPPAPNLDFDLLGGKPKGTPTCSRPTSKKPCTPGGRC